MDFLARGIIKNENGEILLVKHKNSENWVLPGGHIEKGENPHKALKREIKEELGVKVNILGNKLGSIDSEILEELPLPLSIYKLNYTSEKKGKQKRYEYVFVCEIISEEGKGVCEENCDKNEIGEMGWFSVSKISKMKEVYPQIKKLVKSL